MRINYRTVLPLLIIFFSLNVQALSLQPFEADYQVYRNDSYVANAHFSLKKKKGEWLWYMKTRPIGIYSWLTRKRPFAESHMQETSLGPRLFLLHSGDYSKKPPKTSSWFDYRRKTIYYMKGEKISQIELPETVYDYHSVHLLHPHMLSTGQLQTGINFYKKGKLLKSTLTLEKDLKISVEQSSKTVDKITQTFENSPKKMIYYYQGDTLAPLKIESLKPGKEKVIMWRVKVQ